jgi:hypothetical protein
VDFTYRMACDPPWPGIAAPIPKPGRPSCAGTPLQRSRGSQFPTSASSTLELQHDVYLGIYFAVVTALFAAYTISTRLDLREVALRRWKLGVVLGIVVGFALVRNVLSEDKMPHPSGS